MTRTIITAALAVGIAVATSFGNALGVQLSAAPVVDRQNMPGECRAYVNESDPRQYAIACVPAVGWHGGTLDTVWEDGSAAYFDGSVFDPEDMRYRWSS